MANITETAEKFFEACEAGKGWAGCADCCTGDATFSAQAEPLADISTLAGYCDWMQGLYGPLPDARYELKSFATDMARGNVTAFATFHGTNTGEGPVPPTGNKVATDYVYVMDFDGGKISHMTKIWHSGIALQQLGWG